MNTIRKPSRWGLVLMTLCLAAVAAFAAFSVTWTLQVQASDTGLIVGESRKLSDGTTVVVATISRTSSGGTTLPVSGGPDDDDLFIGRFGTTATLADYVIYDFSSSVPTGNDNDTATQIEVDSNGNIYVAGICHMTESGPTQVKYAYVKKFDSNLDPVSGAEYFISNPYEGNSRAMDLKIANGALYFAATTEPSANELDFKLVKLDLSDLSVNTNYPQTYTTATPDEEVMGLAISGNHVYVGCSRNQIYFVAHYDEGGAMTGPTWTSTSNIGSPNVPTGIDIDATDAKDGSPHVIIGGHSQFGSGPEAHWDFTFAKFDYADGDVLLTEQHGSEDHNELSVGCIFDKKAGGVVIGGTKSDLDGDPANFYGAKFSHSDGSLIGDEEVSTSPLEQALALTLDDGTNPSLWITGRSRPDTSSNYDKIETVKFTYGMDLDVNFGGSSANLPGPEGTISVAGTVGYAIGRYVGTSQAFHVRKFTN